MRKRITKRTIDSIEPGSKDLFVWDTDLSGFGCKVTPRGRKVYIFQYRLRGMGEKTAPKRITIGKHGELTADDARKLAVFYKLDVRSGADPAATWRAGDAPSVFDLADRFLNEYLPGKKRPPRSLTVAQYESLFRCHILPRLGPKRVDSVTAADVDHVHSAMHSTPYVANRTLSLLRNAFDQAERWGWRRQHSNPALHIDRYPEERRGEKKEVMLAAEQMSRLLEAIDAEEKDGANPTACAAVRVAFWTGWRIGEVLRLEWDDLDLESGAAKLRLTKTAREEYRQLPAEAVAVLKSIRRLAGYPYVFTGGKRGEHLTGVRKQWIRIRKRAGLERLEGLGPLRIHDLRHNVVSWDVSRGVPLEIAGKNVGHRSRRSTEVYAHFAPDALKRAADDRAQAMRTAVEETKDRERL